MTSPIGIDLRRAVVVGCDTNPLGDAALRFAAGESLRRGVELVVVAAYSAPVDPDLDDIELTEAELRNRAEARARDALCRALAVSPAALPPHHIVVRRGPARRVLLGEFANAGLLVLGTHQHSHISRLLHAPSISAAMIRRARAPIVVVPPAPRASGT